MKGKPKLHILFMLKLYICWNVDIKAKRPPKMNKISRISVRDIHRIYLIQIEISQAVSKILAWIFEINSELNFDLIMGGNFWLRLPKNFGSQILNFARQIYEFCHQNRAIT